MDGKLILVVDDDLCCRNTLEAVLRRFEFSVICATTGVEGLHLAVAHQPMLAVIDANSFYIQAFFRETFVGNFQKGVRAVVTLMSYPDTPLEGSVDSIGWGIAQQNGSTGFEQLPSVKPTFEWIRLAQRLPVMVRIAKVPDNIELRAGTTASVVVITGTGASRDGGQVPPVPRVLQ